MLRQALGCSLFLILLVGPVFPQNKSVVCKKGAAAGLKGRPELDYQCGEQDWDEKQLKSQPEGGQGIRQSGP